MEEDNNLLDAFYKEVFNKGVLPHARYSAASWFGNVENFEAWHSTENFLKESEYECNNVNDFIHFTSFPALLNILTTGYFRMSELRNLLDKQEVLYAAKLFSDILDINFDYPKKFTGSIFNLSMSEFSEMTLKNPFMWEAYSEKGKGVCIRYKFTNPNSYKFLLGKIRYGNEEMDVLRTLKKNIVDYKKTNGPIPNNIGNLLLPLFSFHKAERFRVENEVRFFLNLDDFFGVNRDFGTLFSDKDDKNEERFFNKLFLRGRHEFGQKSKEAKIEFDELLSLYPQVEIMEIYYGYSNSDSEIGQKNEEVCRLRNGYNYEFKQIYIDPDLKSHELKS